MGVLENHNPIIYRANQTTKTRAADPVLMKKLKLFSIRDLQNSGLSRDTIIEARRGARVHPATRVRVAQAIKDLNA